VATRSTHKLRELRDLLHPHRVELVTLDEAGVAPGHEPVEDGSSLAANARLKARYYARLTGQLTLADDSGIEVDLLGGGPGVHTRRYSGPEATDERNNVKLLGELAGAPADRRGARYVCVLALADGRAAAGGQRGGVPIVAETRGTCRGRIATEPRSASTWSVSEASPYPKRP
jgi:XTP/dITP diphosphohydrolase